MKHFLWCFHLFVFLELIVYNSDLPLDEWTCDAFVSSNGSHLEIVWETQGPFKELTWSKNWNSRSHILCSVTNHSGKLKSTQDMWNKIEKLIKTNWVLFLLWKRDRKVMKIRWKKFSHLKWYQIFQNRLIPNNENQKKTLIMRKQLPFRGLRKNRRVTVTC